MRKTMTIRGFILILTLVLAVFLTLHLLMRLEDENRELTDQLSIVGTEDYIVSSARENYSYVSRDDIRFEFTNPEALYTYTEEELRTLVDEMAD